MELPLVKPNILKNILVRILSFGVLILAVRFAYLVTITGGSCHSSTEFCFFHSTSSTVTHDVIDPSRRRKSVEYFSSIFQGLIAENFLSPNSISLSLESSSGEEILALHELGVLDSIGISKKATPPLVIKGLVYTLPFEANSFDFVFFKDGGLNRAVRAVNIGSEVCRILKPGGFFVAHTMGKDEYSLNSFLELFNCCRLVRAQEIDGLDFSSFREIVIRKEIEVVNQVSDMILSGENCLVSAIKRELIRNAEPFIEEEPLKPWTTLKRNLKNAKYLSSMVDISFKNRYVYVDVGARSYGSSIGSWFRKQYPKQNKTFEVFAIEADKSFHEEYRKKKKVTLLPYAAWVKNESLFFEITRDPSKKAMERGRGMGRIQPVQSSMNYLGNVDKIQGFDFASWLKNAVSEKDYVVLKMDVEGTEFHLIPRLIETGAICLVDEMFLECHYNRWQRCCPGQRSPKYQKTYAQCLQLFTSLRERGVLVHMWW